MNPPGRPRGEFRSAQHQGSAVSLLGRLNSEDTAMRSMEVA